MLVLDPGCARAALAGARGLAVAGWEVAIATPNLAGPSSHSRATVRSHRVPALRDGIAPWVATLRRLVEEHGYQLLLPAGDAELLALSECRDALSAAVPYPAHGHVLRALDKLGLCSEARAAELATPRTAALTIEEAHRWEYPAIVKPSLHSSPRNSDTEGRLEALPVADAGEALRAALRIEKHGGDPVIQQFVEGDLLAHTVVIGPDAEVICTVTQRAHRTWPIDAGVSARAVTVAADPALADASARLLRRLGWTGLAQLQFLLDGDGRARLIDLNGRFYGSLSLALKAGVNVPAFWAASATRSPRPNGPRTAPPGVRYQWLEGDLRASLLRGRSKTALLGGTLECLRYWPGAAHGVWDNRDPRPAAASAWLTAGRLATRARGGPPTP